MRRLFLSNFDFEQRLAAPGGSRSSAQRRRNSEWAYAWLAVAAAGDVILTDHPPPPGFSRTLERLGRAGVKFAPDADPSDVDCVVPWGWDDDARRWATRKGFPCDAPPLAAVAMTNRREFSDELERALGIGLDGQSACRSVAEARIALASFEHWIAKSNLGAAGREQLRGTGGLTHAQQAWIERRLRRDGVVFVEPHVTAMAEVGIQWEVPRPEAGPPELIGVVPLRVDERGQYRGSRISNEPEETGDWVDAIALSREAARAVQNLGYFGPLGIDAMRWQTASGGIRLRPCQDVNARWTMGRLALGLRSLLAPLMTAEFRSGPFRPNAASPEVISLSPERGDGAACQRFWLQIEHRGR